MDRPLNLDLEDEERSQEMRLVTELIVLASLAPGELEQQVIDDALGVVPMRPGFPRQRLGH